MFHETRPRFNPKARVPFVNQLAREFGLSKGHVWVVCTGERTSPISARILARQKALLEGAVSVDEMDQGDQVRESDRPEGKCSRPHTELYLFLTALRLSFADLAAKTGYQVSTLHQLASGSNRSRRARRACAQILGIQIWDRPASIAQSLQSGSDATAEPLQPPGKAGPSQFSKQT
jgi:hypothetical protein